MAEFDKNLIFEQLKAASEEWDNHQWSLLLVAAQLDEKGREAVLAVTQNVANRLRKDGIAIDSEDSTTRLPFLNMCLGLSEENLEKLKEIAPEGIKKGPRNSLD